METEQARDYHYFWLFVCRQSRSTAVVLTIGHISFVLYSNFVEFTWIQEEPQNGGAYSFMEPRIRQLLPENKPLGYIGRDPSAAPATGIAVVHRKESADILAKAFRL